jgi:transposase
MVESVVVQTTTEGAMGRYALTDAQYAWIEPALPTNTGKTGHPYGPHRPILNGSLWRLPTGAPWPDLPQRYGNWKTIDDRYVTWRRNGTLDRVLRALQLKLDERGLIDYDQWALDGTVLRAHRVAAGARKKGGPPPVKSRPTTRSDAPSAASRPKSTS